MKRSSALLKADIRDEIARLQRAITEYREAIAGTDLSAPELPSFTKAAIASYVHAFYTGCEHVFRVVSAFFENELGPPRKVLREGWRVGERGGWSGPIHLSS